MFFLNELKKRENFSKAEKLSLFIFKSIVSLFALFFCICAAIPLSSCVLAAYDDGISFDSKSTQGTNSKSLQKTDCEYLVMMYLDGDNNLNNCAWKNLIQAQIGLMNVKSDSEICVVALIDGKSESGTYGDGKTHLYKLAGYKAEQYSARNGSVTSLTSGNTIEYSKSIDWIYNDGIQEVNMASGNTLYNFLNWSKNNFNAEKTILILQTHGGGPYKELVTSVSSNDNARAICWDDTDGGSSYLSTTDEATSISMTFGKIDILVQDACLMCSIEEIYGLKNAVHYLVSSPNITYANTYNYDKIIPYISNAKSLEDIGKKFVDLNKERCQSKTIRQATTQTDDSTCMELSLTLVDCSKSDNLENIKNLTGKLAAEILNTPAALYSSSQWIGKISKNNESEFFGFSFSGSYVYTQDLGVMAYMLAYDVNNQGICENVKEAAKNLYDELRNSGVILYGWSGGSENQWYYSGNSDYGYDFLKISDGKLPWGISITSAKKYANITEYGSWSEFADSNEWSSFLSGTNTNW